MPTTIHMRCGGCDAEKEIPYKRTFHSFSGRDYGLGVYDVTKVDHAAVEAGWVLFDMIGCTYCPECWKQIESGEAA